jgi:hypothetical protein
MPQFKGGHNLDTNNYILEEESNEKRKSHREPVNIFTDYSMSGKFKNNFIKNLSAGGVFIETNEILEVGEYIVLTYNNPNNNENVKIGGVVVRKEQNGFGVKFNIRSKFNKETSEKERDRNTGTREWETNRLLNINIKQHLTRIIFIIFVLPILIFILYPLIMLTYENYLDQFKRNKEIKVDYNEIEKKWNLGTKEKKSW